MSREEPLSRLTSIRARLSVLVAAGGLVAVLVGAAGSRAGVPVWLAVPATLAVALVVTRWLATGLTQPLREMTDAAERMAGGDYDVQIATTARDEVGALARAFTTMASRLAEAEEHRRRLVATVSHELRTPLSAQQALLENLVDGVTTPDEPSLRAALAQSERLGALVGDLLDLSRGDGRGVPLHPEPVAVGELLERAAAEAELQGRDVSLALDVQPADLVVTADQGRLAQVVANLLDNAVRHSPAGGTVTLAARHVTSGVPRWSLVVSDEGPGLSPERAEHLVDRFGAGGDSGGGTGLGLAIAGWVVTMHGGRIEALPPLDGRVGARIRVTLPIEPDLSGATRTDQPTQPAQTARPAQAEKEMAMSPADRPESTPRPAAAARPAGTGTAGAPGPAGSRAVAARPAPALPPEGAVRATAPAAPGLATLARWWPERDAAPQPRLLLTALAVGLAAAVLVVDAEIGLGLLLVLALGGVLIWRTSPHRATRWSWLTAALALPLGLTTVLRADVGYVLLAMLTAGVLAAIACTRATTLVGMALSVAAWPTAGLRGLPLLDRTVRRLGRRGNLWSGARILVVSLALLLVFGGLLASADAVLGSWAAHLVPTLSDVLVLRVFTAVFFTGITLCGLYLALNPPRVEGRSPTELVSSRIPVREWQIPMLVVIAVYLAFLAAQVAAVTGGHDYVLRTTGLTYADSARQGFGQLTLATLLTVLLVAGVRAWGRVETARDRHRMQLTCAALCLLALGVVVSALRRMALYQEAYGYTVARVLADLVEVWFGLVLLALLVSLFAPSRRWLGRAVLLTGVAAVLAFTVGGTTGFVAERNLDRYADGSPVDVAHLARLGDEAVPAVHASALPTRVKACILLDPELRGVRTADPGAEDTATGLSRLAGWNLSRDRAAEIRAGYTLPDDCASDRESVR